MARTEAAWIDVRQVVADRTEDDLFLDFADGCDQAIGFFLRSPEHMKGQTLRRFVTDAWQAFEFVYEFCYRFCVIKHIRPPPGYINPGIFNPPRAPPRRLLAFSSTLRPHSLIAAMIRSCSISMSVAASGSILTERTSLRPFISTFTMPPPAVESTRRFSISFIICSCIF